MITLLSAPLLAAFPLSTVSFVPAPGSVVSLPSGAAPPSAVGRSRRLTRTRDRLRRRRLGHLTSTLETGGTPAAPTSSSRSLAARSLLESARIVAAPVGEERELGGIELAYERDGRGRPLVDSKQVSPEEVERRWPDSNFDVPVDMPGAMKTFFEQPTPGFIVAGILSVVAMRLSCDAPLGLADAVAVPVIAAGWSFQEWAIHKYLLHGMKNWLGHDIHEGHHDKPFYHVCVDPPDLVAGWTIAAACVFRLLLPAPLSLTVLAVYMFMGLVYEWVHYIVHTRVVPRSQLGKDLKRHHTLHHLKDETCWLAFTVPQIDSLLGTVPDVEPRKRTVIDP